jgi:AraC family transcriptional regulator of adaptative response / DNA-3-methyladenine glycosylase II
MLDLTKCDRARLARDPAYNGSFYTGVRTTGVYCRPVCPVRPAQSRNVRFFPSAAAAEAARFRPVSAAGPKPRHSHRPGTARARPSHEACA